MEKEEIFKKNKKLKSLKNKIICLHFSEQTAIKIQGADKVEINV